MSEEVARRLHEAAIDVDVLGETPRLRQGWDTLELYEKYRYLGAADIVVAHVAEHGDEHREYLVERVHELRRNRSVEPEWDHLTDDERRLARDLVEMLVAEVR